MRGFCLICLLKLGAPELLWLVSPRIGTATATGAGEGDFREISYFGFSQNFANIF
jgi:hypothetical protein